ncbi:hypothetical protein HK101_002842 [Irineochytrium annulatum]|nr:hypothetical protein HK101_002842 [Irineochytrium annulatum]
MESHHDHRYQPQQQQQRYEDGNEQDDGDLDPEVTLDSVIGERDELRAQNENLWKIIERQRTIIHELKAQLGKFQAAPTSPSVAISGGGVDSSPPSPRQYPHPHKPRSTSVNREREDSRERSHSEAHTHHGTSSPHHHQNQPSVGTNLASTPNDTPPADEEYMPPTPSSSSAQPPPPRRPDRQQSNSPYHHQQQQRQAPPRKQSDPDHARSVSRVTPDPDSDTQGYRSPPMPIHARSTSITEMESPAEAASETTPELDPAPPAPPQQQQGGGSRQNQQQPPPLSVSMNQWSKPSLYGGAPMSSQQIHQLQVQYQQPGFQSPSPQLNPQHPDATYEPQQQQQQDVQQLAQTQPAPPHQSWQQDGSSSDGQQQQQHHQLQRQHSNPSHGHQQQPHGTPSNAPGDMGHAEQQRHQPQQPWNQPTKIPSDEQQQQPWLQPTTLDGPAASNAQAGGSSIQSTSGVQIHVLSSTLLGGEKGRGDIVSFSFGVRGGQAGAGGWIIEKTYADVAALDHKLRTTVNRAVIAKVGKPPERSLFTTLNPAKSDQRRVALELFLQRVIDVLPDSKDVIEFVTTNVASGAGGLGNTSVVGNATAGAPAGGAMESTEKSPPSTKKNSAIKEGYLVKKGKNFGGWKTRYFKCRTTVLEYYDSSGRELMGSIRLKCCLIARNANERDAKSHHSFTLTEYKPEAFQPPIGSADSVPSESRVVARHTLSSESDVERDDWVRAISAQILKNRPGARIDPTILNAIHPMPELPMPADLQRSGSQQQHPQAMRFRDNSTSSIQSNASHNQGGQESPRGNGSTASVPQHRPSGDQQQQQQQPRNVGEAQAAALQYLAIHNPANRIGFANGAAGSGPPSPGLPHHQPPSPGGGGRSGYVDDTARILQQNPPPLITREVQEMMSARSLGAKPSGNLSGGDDRRNKRMTTFNWGKKAGPGGAPVAGGAGHPGGPNGVDEARRVVFGVPLDQSVAVSRVNDAYELPSVVYRCIEYLDAMRAWEEEGIYRLSGLTSLIQQLKERFNTEGDVDLLGSGEPYDVHAIAGLLKLYLRELQTQQPVLTKQLQSEFVHVTDLADRNDRVNELSRLVGRMPLANYTLLRVVIAHLIKVVQRSGVNKMSVRNVGIVFTPTLGVPVVVLTLMMAEYDTIFCWGDPERARIAREREREREIAGREQREQMERRQREFEEEVASNDREREREQQNIKISIMNGAVGGETSWEGNAGSAPAVMIMGENGSEVLDEEAARRERKSRARRSMVAPGTLGVTGLKEPGNEKSSRPNNRNSFVNMATVQPSRPDTPEESDMLDMYDGSAGRPEHRGGTGGGHDGEVMVEEAEVPNYRLSRMSAYFARYDKGGNDGGGGDSGEGEDQRDENGLDWG